MKVRGFIRPRGILVLQVFVTLCFVLCLTSCGGADKKGMETESDLGPVATSSWFSKDDDSRIVFSDETNYIWYQVKDNLEDNYYTGTYQFYEGEDALQYITTDLAEYGATREEVLEMIERNKAFTLNNFVCMTFTNASFLLEGEEKLDEAKDTSYYGFMVTDRNYMVLVHMATSAQYRFQKERKEA